MSQWTGEQKWHDLLSISFRIIATGEEGRDIDHETWRFYISFMKGECTTWRFRIPDWSANHQYFKLHVTWYRLISIEIKVNYWTVPVMENWFHLFHNYLRSRSMRNRLTSPLAIIFIYINTMFRNISKISSFSFWKKVWGYLYTFLNNQWKAYYDGILQFLKIDMINWLEKITRY
jgi:hypothetical protein